MMITNKTIISFDPVKEHDAMVQFERDNDMRDWVKVESTAATVYMCTKTMWAGGDGDH